VVDISENDFNEAKRLFAEGVSNNIECAVAHGTVLPKGKWIIDWEDDAGIHRIKCPFCNYKNGTLLDAVMNITFHALPPFCESCGADLRDSENECL